MIIQSRESRLLDMSLSVRRISWTKRNDVDLVALTTKVDYVLWLSPTTNADIFRLVYVNVKHIPFLSDIFQMSRQGTGLVHVCVLFGCEPAYGYWGHGTDWWIRAFHLAVLPIVNRCVLVQNRSGNSLTRTNIKYVTDSLQQSRSCEADSCVARQEISRHKCHSPLSWDT